MRDRPYCGIAFLFLLIPALLSGCLITPLEPSPPTPTPVKEPVSDSIASMGDVVLAMGPFQSYLNRLPAHTKNRLLRDREALAQRIRWEVTRKYLVKQAQNDDHMLQEGAIRKKTLAEEETLRTRYLSFITVPRSNYPDQETVMRAYREMVRQSAQSMKVRLRQIFVSHGENHEAARVKSEAVLAMAKKPHADFATLASRFSMDQTTAEQGGDMGFVPLEALPASFREGLKGVEDGEIFGPVETDQGFYIIKKVAEDVPEHPSFAEMAAGLRKKLRQQQTAENLKHYLTRWTQDNPIVFNPEGMALLTPPRVP
ncbi:MAG: peptidylprolyl isomerase [Magnetococcales bacterium]|nr:peptidylprolyl isomerase [Magnetococcales bacterium]